jgi:hypothetical protein
MSKLSYIGRPWVVFDATNKDHRKWFEEFQRLKTWGRCPVRFVVNESGTDLLQDIQRQLVSYYVEREFKRCKDDDAIKSKTKEKLPSKRKSY